MAQRIQLGHVGKAIPLLGVAQLGQADDQLGARFIVASTQRVGLLTRQRIGRDHNIMRRFECLLGLLRRQVFFARQLFQLLTLLGQPRLILALLLDAELLLSRALFGFGLLFGFLLGLVGALLGLT